MRCGSKTLQYIAKRVFNTSLSDEESDRLCSLGPDGVSPEGLVSGFREIGLHHCQVVRNTDLATLQTIINAGGVVAICYVDGSIHAGHWICVHHAIGQLGDSVFIWDSDTGYREVPDSWLLPHWFDYAVNEGEWILYRHTAVVGYANGVKPIV